MNTREYAVELRKAADFVEMDIYVSLNPVRFHIGFYNKEKFLQAVKAIGGVIKKYTQGDYAKLQLTSTEEEVEAL